MKRATFGALEGLKVLDLTMVLAGPFCTMLLADQGAEVLKIEPLTGDMTRKIGPFFEDDTEHSYGGYFQSINRNKKSIALDLKSTEGKNIFLNLVSQADVLVENYRTGVMDRLGLGYEALSKVNSRLVYAALRGFGDPRTGVSPYADWPAYDVVAQAMGGIVGVTGVNADQPIKIGPGIGDIAPAIFLAFGILAAVRNAERTGQGQFVDVAMYDAILSLCERIVYQYAYTHKIPVPEGNQHPLLCPFGIFPARDGWVAIGCLQDSFWPDLCHAMQRLDLANDPLYATTASRLARRDDVVGIVTAWSSKLSKAEIGTAIGGRVPYGPVHTAEDIFLDPHTASRKMLIPIPHAGSQTISTVANSPVRMTRTDGGARYPSPRLSEHADEILTNAGYSAADIADFKSKGVVR